MNSGMALVRAYMRVNGYFVMGGTPVVSLASSGQYHSVTDLDILAVRLPHSRLIVKQASTTQDQLVIDERDPVLDVPSHGVDVLIGEVKEGKAKLNRALRSPEVLEVALAAVGVCPSRSIHSVTRELSETGRAEFTGEVGPCRARIVAFGNAPSGEGSGYTIISLTDITKFLWDVARKYRDILQPVQLNDPVLSLFHLIQKLELGEV